MFVRTFPEDYIKAKNDNKDESALLEIEDSPQITDTKFDLTEMVTILLGKEFGVMMGAIL